MSQDATKQVQVESAAAGEKPAPSVSAGSGPAEVTRKVQVPKTFMDRFMAVVLAAIFIGLGVYMVMNPEVMGFSEELSRARTRLWARVLEFVWSWPVGVLLVLFGLICFSGAFGKTKEVEVKATEGVGGQG